MKLLFILVLAVLLIQGCKVDDIDDYSYQISQYNIKIQALGIEYNNDYSKEIQNCKTRYIDRYDKQSCVDDIRYDIKNIYSNILNILDLEVAANIKGYQIEGGAKKKILKCLKGFPLISLRDSCISDFNRELGYETLNLKPKKKDST